MINIFKITGSVPVHFRSSVLLRGWSTKVHRLSKAAKTRVMVFKRKHTRSNFLNFCKIKNTTHTFKKHHAELRPTTAKTFRTSFLRFQPRNYSCSAKIKSIPKYWNMGNIQQHIQWPSMVMSRSDIPKYLFDLLSLFQQVEEVLFTGEKNGMKN